MMGIAGGEGENGQDHGHGTFDLGGHESTPRFDVLGGDAADGAADRLALGDEQRLPWLEGADDVDLDDEEPGNGRFIGFAVLGLLVLAAIVGGVYWMTHREGPVASADGSLIEASREPYKIAPRDPGGKTFQGTGDSSFRVSDGEKPVANLAGGPVANLAGGNAPRPSASASAPAASASSSGGGQATGGQASGGQAGGVGVQVGAYSSSSTAEAGWNKLVSQHEALKGLSHRIVEGKADIGTVYRLQAVAGDVAAANALCGRLQSAGLKCQVKR